MAGGNYNQGQPGDYPSQPQQPQHPQQQPYPQQQYGPQDYAAQQPYGHAYAQPQWMGGFAPPHMLPTECFGGFWIRFVAYIIDAFVLAIPSVLVGAAVMAAFGFSPAIAFDFNAQMSASQDMRYQLANNLSSVAQLLMAWPYYALMHSYKGATLGKMAIGLRVVEANGMHISFARATGRYFATILSACMCLIGYIWAGFHPQKRAIHDLIAGTWVVRKEFVNPQQQGANPQPYGQGYANPPSRPA